MKNALGVFRGMLPSKKATNQMPDSSKCCCPKTCSETDVSSLIRLFDNNATLKSKMNNSMSSLCKGIDNSSNSSRYYDANISNVSSTTLTSNVKKRTQMIESKINQEVQEKQNGPNQEKQHITKNAYAVSYTVRNSNNDKRNKITFQNVNNISESSPEKEFYFEQKKMLSSLKSKTDSSSLFRERAKTDNKNLEWIMTNDLYYVDKHSFITDQSMKTDGYSPEKVNVCKKDQAQSKTEENIHHQQKIATTSSHRLATDEYTAEKLSTTTQDECQYFTQTSLQHETKVSSSKMLRSSSNTKSIFNNQHFQEVGFERSLSPSIESPMISFLDDEPFCRRVQDAFHDIIEGFNDDLRVLQLPSSPSEVDKAMTRFCSRLESCIKHLQTSNEHAKEMLLVISKIITKTWNLPFYRDDLGHKLCDILRTKGGLDTLISNCKLCNESIKFASAQLLENCLTDSNRSYIVENGLRDVVTVACSFCKTNSIYPLRIGTGILENLFRHSEEACSKVIKFGGLNAVLHGCRHIDMFTLRHCARALANLSLFGGPDNQQAMIKVKVPVWLFPLAFSYDDNIKYYACLAIATLVTNKEIEAEVLRSGTLDLVEPFVSSKDPDEFVRKTLTHIYSQSKEWLLRLVPVLDSNREEARSLAAFHFAVEAGIKKKLGNTEIFHDIGSIGALKRVASSPNAIASKYAAQALHLIGEEIPHKLSQQVPLWTVEDVQQWVKQIGFGECSQEFVNSQVDGDLLLQLTEDMLRNDIGIKNGILRKRFSRELLQLKKKADYSSCDMTYLSSVLHNLGPEFSQYTYLMLQNGLSMDVLPFVMEDQLEEECGIQNSIHRRKIWRTLQRLIHSPTNVDDVSLSKTLDVFISYRRSNGSQLASLLKVHLQLRGFSVFIDVERLEAGKFDRNLINSIRQAKNFLLVLTPDALDRCKDDNECKDWVHREIVEALHSRCTIIPIIDSFHWPELDCLPDDMRTVCSFNGVRWIHDYQEACVDKLERFMRKEVGVRPDGFLGQVGIEGAGTPGSPNSKSERQKKTSYDRGVKESLVL